MTVAVAQPSPASAHGRDLNGLFVSCAILPQRHTFVMIALQLQRPCSQEACRALHWLSNCSRMALQLQKPCTCGDSSIQHWQYTGVCLCCSLRA